MGGALAMELGLNFDLEDEDEHGGGECAVRRRCGISAGKEVDIGLGGGCDQALRPADMLLYSWEGGLDVCVDLTGSSPLTQTGIAGFVPGRAVIDAAQRKRGKYMTKCADIGYGFLPFSFSSFGELEKDAVTLLKWVRKFSMAQDIGARAAVHIFNRISFFIAKGVWLSVVVGLLQKQIIIIENRYLDSVGYLLLWDFGLVSSIFTVGVCRLESYQAGGLSGRFSDSYRLLFTCLLVLGSLLYCYMAIVRFHCPFAGLSGCHDSGGNGLTNTSLITHLRDRHCNGEAQAITKHFLLSDLVVFKRDELDHVDGLLHEQHDGFILSLLDSSFSKGLRKVKSIPPKCRLGFSRVLKGAIDKGLPGGSMQLVRETLAESSSPIVDVDKGDLELSEQNLKQCKRKICDGHYTAAVRVLSSSGVAPYNNATLQELKAKHPFKSAPSLPDMPTDHHHLIASHDVVLDRIKSFLVARLMVGMVACPTPYGLLEWSSCGGVRPIVVGTVWRRLVSKFGVGVFGGGEAILHAINHLVEDRGDDIGLSKLLVDFQNAFNLVDQKVMLEEVRLRCPAISRWVELCYSSPARLFEVEKARRRGKVFNWETAMYDKIWDNEDVHDLGSVETEFPAIVFNDTLTSEATLSCEPTVSSLNNDEIDFRISFDEFDDEDCTNDNDKVDTEHSSGDLSVKPLPDVINTDVGAYAHGTVYTVYSLNEYNIFDTDINTTYPGVWIRRILGYGYDVSTSCTVLGPRWNENDDVGGVSTNLEVLES
ncbi:hypothetical protein Tco_0852295 [Tanacetum coccineum]